MSDRIVCGAGRELIRDRTHIMAIINLTDDSFSGDGNLDCATTLAHAAAALAAGAAILDCGAESTRPGARAIGLDEEAARLLPILRELTSRFPQALFSVDTTKPEIFQAAHAAGAGIANSVAGALPALVAAVAATDAALVICDPGVPGRNSPEQVAARLAEAGAQAEGQGIARERIVVDPGFGFGKTPDENIALLREFARITRGRYASLLGASRKSTLGRLTGKPTHEREFATAATTTIAAIAYCDIVRVHNVAATSETLALTDAVTRGRRPADWLVDG